MGVCLPRGNIYAGDIMGCRVQKFIRRN